MYLFASTVLFSRRILNRSTFFAFPDLYEEHNMQWCECLARTIFSSIDDLRIQLWRVLCRLDNQ
jgi:hypothetical protein